MAEILIQLVYQPDGLIEAGGSITGTVKNKLFGKYRTDNLPLNYGSNLCGLVANLSVRQYMPYKRTAEFIADIFGIAMSEGSISNLLKRFTDSARKSYDDIRQGILLEPIVGADETGAKVNGKRNWFHTYQTSDHTFIGFHPSRGIKGRKHFYPDGLPSDLLTYGY